MNTAYEVKFLVPTDRSPAILQWAQAHLPADPHAESGTGSYDVSTLYLDNSDWDAYHKQKGCRWTKYRVRRYGAEKVVYLEVKSRRRARVAKYRVCVDEAELALLGSEGRISWAGSWFQQGSFARGLRPVLGIQYRRAAYAGGTLRLTVDTDLVCGRAEGYAPSTVRGLPMNRDFAIVELKFQGTLPEPVRELATLLCGAPASISKYRLGVETAELGPTPKSEALSGPDSYGQMRVISSLSDCA